MKSQQKLHFTSNPLKDKICCSYYICHIKSVKLSSLHWVLWNFMPPIKNSWIDSCFHAFDLETNVTKVWLHSYSDSKALSKTCAKPYILFYCIDNSCRSESNQLHGGTQYSICCHLTPLIRDIFPDSQIAKQYSSCRTKITSMLNLAIAPHFLGEC